MVIWIDSLEKTIGNPILVEWKMGRIAEQRLIQTELKLLDCLNKAKSPLALLVYFDFDGRQFPSSKYKFANIIRLDIHSLINRAAKHDIDRLILEERNRIAHGESL
jgi:hypothetical protein